MLRTRPTLPLLAAQFADGAGAKFHAVALSLYVLSVAGLTGVGGFVASGLVGSAVAVAVAAGASQRFGGATVMRTTAASLLTTRLAAYVLIASGAGVGALMVTQLFGSISGTVLINCSKAQAPPQRRARTLAWMGVCNGAGAIGGSAAAGLLTVSAPTPVIVAVGVAGAVVSTLPMLILSKRTVTTPVPLADQWQAAKQVAGPIAVGGAVFAVVATFEMLKTGLVAELYGASWVGAVTAAGVAGTWSAAVTIDRARARLARAHYAGVWPWLGVAPLATWAFADVHVAWLLVASAVSGTLLGWLAVSVEAAVLDRAEGAGPAALTFSGTGAAVASTVTVTVAPELLDGFGFAPVAAVGVGLLVLLACGSSFLRRGGHPASAEATSG